MFLCWANGLSSMHRFRWGGWTWQVRRSPVNKKNLEIMILTNPPKAVVIKDYKMGMLRQICAEFLVAVSKLNKRFCKMNGIERSIDKTEERKKVFGR